MSIKVKYSLYIIIVLFFVVVITYNVVINSRVGLTRVFLDEEVIVPEDFKGFRLVQVSDFHNGSFGKDQYLLLDKVKEANPDVILITGDLIDSRNTKVNVAIDFVREAIKIAPIYFISGNHEAWIKDYESLRSKLIDEGVCVLDNESVVLKNGQSTLKISGMVDPDFYEGSGDGEIVSESLASIKGESSDFSILLAHRPDLFEVYARFDYDLIFSGHAHGGQFRFPFIGGLLAPDQGIFPKYDSGLYRLGKTRMIVSRGLGNSLFPFRLFNGPELIVVEL